MINEVLRYILVFVAGAILGAAFFGGLWLTVQQLPRSKHPALLFLFSGIARTILVITGIWLVANRDPVAVVTCLGGFVCTRVVTMQNLERSNAASRSEQT